MEKLLNYIYNVSISNDQWYIVYIVYITISYLLYLLTRKIVLKSISHLSKKTSTNLDDILIGKGIFKRLSYLVPLIFLYYSPLGKDIGESIDRVLLALIAIIIVLSLNAFINALSDIYSRTKYSDRLNIKSYIQIIKLLVNIFGIIIVIALLTGKSPLYFLSGIGALTAVLIIVFNFSSVSNHSSQGIDSDTIPPPANKCATLSFTKADRNATKKSPPP